MMIRRASGFAPLSEEDNREKHQFLFVKRGYLLIYLALFIMALTGLGLAFEDIPLLREWHKGITNIHSIVQYVIYAYILFHLIGVIRADSGKNKGLVSGMIHGWKDI